MSITKLENILICRMDLNLALDSISDGDVLILKSPQDAGYLKTLFLASLCFTAVDEQLLLKRVFHNV